MTSKATIVNDISYLSQSEAVAVDEELMGPLGFSVDQLMELAGLSVACSVAAEAPKTGKVLVLAGPGNNGGDGLVAARHLHHFGYPVSVCYPKRTDRPLYHGLVTQCACLRLPFLDADDVVDAGLADYAVVIDALFGFSFRGPPRPPFDGLLRKLAAADPDRTLVASVDVPSGWHVEDGDAAETGLRPGMLISLTAPKLAARFFEGPHHYLGGRFVPPEIRDKFGLRLPEYPDTAMCVKLAAAEAAPAREVHAMRNNVQAAAVLLGAEAAAKDPIALFGEWFEAAAASSGSEEPNAMALATAGRDGDGPDVRIVLLKGFDSRGFTFFTNYGSAKAADIDGSGAAAACFYWEHLGRQVRVRGPAARVPEAESEKYFASRPRGSQLGAWSSEQSAVIADRQVLQDKMRELEERYAGGAEIPKPPFWGGYRIAPTSIEFWNSQPSRTHERLRFRREDGAWVSEVLSP